MNEFKNLGSTIQSNEQFTREVKMENMGISVRDDL